MSSWIAHSAPDIIGRLLATEPVLVRRIVCWRWANGLEAITVDRRGRYWLWREQRTRFLDDENESPGEGGSSRHLEGCVVMVPQYGPVAAEAVEVPSLTDLVRSAVADAADERTEVAA